MNDWPRYVNFIWSVADLLRGDYKQSEYGRVILPFVVLRRLDCVLEPTKAAVLEVAAKNTGMADRGLDLLLRRASGEAFYNTSKLHFPTLLDDANNVAGNLRAYIADFSPGATEVLDKYSFDDQITRLDQAGLLYLVTAKFADIDLHPDTVSNLQMGYIFEELIRRFSEQSNETAGEHFTPREVIRLMVNLLFVADDEALRRQGAVRTLYDPACGTGGMLSVAEDHLRSLNPDARLEVFGQELNDESYAICRSDMMLKGQDPSHIAVGNTLTRDAFEGEHFDYLISNPPFGVEWKKIKKEIEAEHKQLGSRGRFGAGLPRINDGSLLFLQHMISKMKSSAEGGSRVAIVFNGSPLFSGSAGGLNENGIRRWIIENDWLEAVIALPDQLFYNTGINTYIWLVTNHKAAHREGKVQLIDGRHLWEKPEKSLGEKRKRLSADHIDELVRLYGEMAESDISRVMLNDEFAYRRVTVERPLRLRYEVTHETLETLAAAKAFVHMAAPPPGATDPTAAIAAGEREQERLLSGLEELLGLSSADRSQVAERLAPVLAGGQRRLPANVVKAVWDAVSVPDPGAPVVVDGKKGPKPDPDLRDYENVPVLSDLEEFFQREVLSHAPDAWIDHSKEKLGYEIAFTRYFYRYIAPPPLEELDAELRRLESESRELFGAVEL